MMDDTISRQAAIKDAESWVAVDEYEKHLQKNVVEWLKEFPPAELGTDCISDVEAEHIRVYLGKRKRNSEALFVSQMTKGRYTDSGIMQMVKQVGARAEVTDVHPHRFRRTFATEMHRRGMEIHMISKLMGHANIATTQRYIYTADDHLHAEYNKYSA